MSFWTRHHIFEKNSIVLVVGILAVIAVGGLVEITPLFYLKNTIEKVDGVRPYTPLELAGRNIYVREGCYLCHSQMIRPLRDEVERYGHYSLAAESMIPEQRDFFHWLSALIALPAAAYSGQPFFISAFRALRAGRTNMDVPISIGIVLALLMLERVRQGRFDADQILAERLR